MSTATENIDTMPAGAALDAAVAEKVMGWPTCRDPACGGDCGAPVFLTASGWHVGKPDEIEEDWSPSTNANDTMDVLAELHRQGCVVELQSGAWSIFKSVVRDICAAKVSDFNIDQQFQATADTLPLVVCRAALARAESRRGQRR